MKTTYLIPILCSFFIVACNPDPDNKVAQKPLAKKVVTSVLDTTPKVTGIGGLFFKTKNPSAAKDWYRKNLGMSIDQFGAPFEFRNAHRPAELNYLNWDAFPDTTSYFEPSIKEFMINYRVQNIEALVKNLQKNGVTIVDEIAEYEYGKFVHIMDLEGNKIELWEPVDSVLIKLKRKANN